MFRPPFIVYSLVACAALAACGGARPGGNSSWDRYDYARIARQKLPRDNDADYSLPAQSCVDDAPDCQ